MRKVSVLLITAALCAATFLPPLVLGQRVRGSRAPGTLDHIVPGAARFVPDEILIQYKSDVTEDGKIGSRSAVGAYHKQKIRRGNAKQGELELASLPSGIGVEEAIRILDNHPSVEFAEPNWIYTTQAAPSDPAYTNGTLWGMYGDATSPSNLYGSQAGEAWARGSTGSNSVYIGIIDDGLQFDHPDLDANVWANPYDPANGVDDDGNGYVDDVHGWDFINNDNTVYDDYATGNNGHGTHIAGVIGAEADNASDSPLNEVVGVNWAVTMIPVKCTQNYSATAARAVQCIDYVTNLKTRHGLNIVATNNSWGGYGSSQALLAAITRAAQANILFVAAAGNQYGNNDSFAFYPANYNTTAGAGYDSVISVAAIDKLGKKPAWSNYGAKTVDLGAPGVAIYSTRSVNRYLTSEGTSYATAYVTGAVALYASTHPGASALTIRNAILNAAKATPTSSMSGKTVTGGRLNVSGF